MREAVQSRARLAFWLLLAAATAVRLALAGRLGLGIDESHYVLYGRHLAWGYFDHPPMVGFLAALTGLWGDGSFFARLGPIACAAAAVILLRRLALALYRDERIALAASGLLLLMPAHHLLSVALLPDAPLNLFWCAALLAAWQAMRRESWALWLAAGGLFGLALLSKYHGVLLGGCLVLYVATSPVARVWLTRPQPYAAAALGLLLFLPNVAWNARHDWISYAFQLGRGGGHAGVGKLLLALGGQLVAASPVIAGLLVAAWATLILWRRLRSEENRFVLWTSLPVFAFFGVIGATGKILPHWPFVGWWTGSLALASVLVERLDAGGSAARRWRRWSIAGAAVGACLVALTYTCLFTPVVEPLYEGARRASARLHGAWPRIPALGPYALKYDPTNDLYGWLRAAQAVERLRGDMPHPGRTFVFSHRFHLASLLAVYLDRETAATSLSRKPSQYRIWFDAGEHAGWDALLVDNTEDADRIGRYRRLFERMDGEPTIIEIRRGGRVAHRLRIYRCYGFDGSYAVE